MVVARAPVFVFAEGEDIRKVAPADLDKPVKESEN